jgi:hypothetical protein
MAITTPEEKAELGRQIEKFLVSIDHPGEMEYTQENMNRVTDTFKEMGNLPENEAGIRAAYIEARMRGILTLRPLPAPAPVPPQIVEVKVEVPVAPRDRRSSRDKLLDVGVTPHERNYRGKGDTQKAADLQTSAQDVLSAIFKKGTFKPTELDSSASEARLPIDITDEELTSRRRDITASQLRDLGRRRSHPAYKKK